MGTKHSVYKRLGNYIREVDIRNRDLAVTQLSGVSISKEFIPSIANTIGTDMSAYKIVKHGQFVYIADTSRRGNKIAIALQSNADNSIVSQAYTVFEITDRSLLLPEYLMMWFRRPEFDRYARFHSHGSAREIFDWEEMCDVHLPIPPIECQRELVAEYETLSRRIRLNEQFISRLESLAQALYRRTFVDSIDKENLPASWRMGTIGELGNIVGGATPSTSVPEYWTDRGIHWISPVDISRQGRKFIVKGEKDITDLGYKSASTRLLPTGSVLFSSRAPIGLIAIADDELCTNQGFKSIVPHDEFGTFYIYCLLKEEKEKIEAQASGSIFPEISGECLRNYPTVIPESSLCDSFSAEVEPIFAFQKSLERECNVLTQIRSLILARVGSIK